MTIEEIIKIEEQYKKEKLEGIENIDFTKILEENNLTFDEYQYKKAENYLKTFRPTYIVVEVRCMGENKDYEVARAFAGKNTFLCGEANKKMVWYAKEEDINREYCEANNIDCLQKPYLGGAICVMPTDLDVSIVAKGATSYFSRVIIDKLAEWVKKGTDANVTIDKNDILINGEKVLGMANYEIDDVFICGFHMSFDKDLDFIKNVCAKEMKKIPACLNDYGEYNRDDLVYEMVEWLS